MSHPSFSSPGTLGYSGKRPMPSLGPAGIRTGEIIAWRAWYPSRQGLLRSMAVDCIWYPGETMTLNSRIEQLRKRIAEDTGTPWWLMNEPQKRITLDNGVGVYALKAFQDVAAQYFPLQLGTMVAYGTVALWGEVIEYERGYRAEFGRVNTIDVIDAIPLVDPSGDILQRLRIKYGVEGKRSSDFGMGP